MACQHFPDDQTLQLQAGAGEDDVIHLPSGLDRVDCERQEEEEEEVTFFRMCQNEALYAVYIFHLTPTQLVWNGVIQDMKS